MWIRYLFRKKLIFMKIDILYIPVYETPYPSIYALNKTTIVLLKGWIWL